MSEPTEQKQFHLPGGLLSVFPQVFINHFTPLHGGFVLGADRAAHFFTLKRLRNCRLPGFSTS